MHGHAPRWARRASCVPRAENDHEPHSLARVGLVTLSDKIGLAVTYGGVVLIILLVFLSRPKR